MSGTTKEATRPANSRSGTLFKNKFLERLTRTHISVPIIILCSFAAGMIIWASLNTSLIWSTILGLFLVGFFTFTLVEYLVHRYLFHITPSSKARERFQYNVHGVHHEFPKDKERLAMPPILSTTISIMLLVIFNLIMGDYVFGFLPGFLVGYSGYLGVHFIVHAYQPPKNFFKKLWIHHGIHHYKNHDAAFGVSSPLWDYVFRTLPSRK